MKINSEIYLCSRTSSVGSDIVTFSKPTKYILKPRYLTIQPTGGYLDIQEFGEYVNSTYRGIAYPYQKWENVFKEGDRVYLNKIPNGYTQNTEPEIGWGNDADAEIIAVRYQNKAIMIILRNILQ